MFVLFLKRSLVVSLASFFISGAGIAHGVEETSPLPVIETESTPVIEPESTPEVSSVPPKREPSFQASNLIPMLVLRERMGRVIRQVRSSDNYDTKGKDCRRKSVSTRT